MKENAIQVAYDPISKRVYSSSGSPNYRYTWENSKEEEFDDFNDLTFEV